MHTPSASKGLVTDEREGQLLRDGCAQPRWRLAEVDLHLHARVDLSDLGPGMASARRARRTRSGSRGRSKSLAESTAPSSRSRSAPPPSTCRTSKFAMFARRHLRRGGHVVLENRKKDRVQLVHPAWLGSHLASERMRFTPANHSDGPHWLARAIPHARTREHRVAHSPHESPQRGHVCRVGGSCG